jgi:hypothetical protein
MGGHRFQLGVPVAVGTGADQTINRVRLKKSDSTGMEDSGHRKPVLRVA